MPNFLLEIGTEEIPAGYIDRVQLNIFGDILKKLLTDERLSYREMYVTATPRRIVFHVSELPKQSASLTKEVTGPKEQVAYDRDGKPTPALLGFAKRYNLSLDQIKLKETPQGKICATQLTTQGEKTKLILTRLIEPLIKKLPFPKSMWWLDKTLSFPRPIRYLLPIFERTALKLKINSIPGGHKSYGHPWLSDRKAVLIKSADLSEYQSKLKKAFVIVDTEERKTIITEQINQLTKQYAWMVQEPALLNEVTNLVEYPAVQVCNFDEKYLILPEAVLTTAMKSHQRFFPVRDRRGILLPKFLVVTNNNPKKDRLTPPKAGLIQEGNERVLKARLADALFFWEQDKKQPLFSRKEKLKNITFLGTLGSFYEKTERLKTLGKFIAEESGLVYPAEAVVDTGVVQDTVRAAELCKTDLLTEMVYEFPELQGLMGYEYARQQHEPKNVALAIKEHYLPRFAGDGLPTSRPGIFLSLAEKFDNLTACFVLNMVPSGSQDPYALRRQALGIIRIIQTKQLTNLSLNKIIDFSLTQILQTIKNLSDKGKITLKTVEEHRRDILAFIEDRLVQFYLENAYQIDLIRAVLKTSSALDGTGFDKIPECTMRLNALRELSRQPLWPQLVELVERTYNIGKKASVAGEVNPDLLKEPEEKEVWEIYQQNKDKIQELIEQRNYLEASTLYAGVFAEPVHKFFDKVYVNVEDETLRNNRILLMTKINLLYSARIAKLFLLAVK